MSYQSSSYKKSYYIKEYINTILILNKITDNWVSAMVNNSGNYMKFFIYLENNDTFQFKVPITDPEFLKYVKDLKKYNYKKNPMLGVYLIVNNIYYK